MVYHSTNVMERRREITGLLVRGFTPGEIAKGLKISRETVYNDVRYLRSGRNEDLAEYGRKQILAQVMLNGRERVKELWSVVEKSESPYVKLLALRELRIHDQQILNHLFLFTQTTSDCHCEQGEAERGNLITSEASNLTRKSNDRDCSLRCAAHLSQEFRSAGRVVPPDGVTPRNDKTEELSTPAKSVNLCRKSLLRKENRLQMDKKAGNFEECPFLLARRPEDRYNHGLRDETFFPALKGGSA